MLRSSFPPVHVRRHAEKQVNEMVAIAFQANPERWTNDGTMRDYLENEDRYIYWSTPEDEVQARNVPVGIPALIVRTQSTGRFGLRAIVAVGTVEESPRRYRPGENDHEFALPRRLQSPGDDHAASSDWKTGIRLSEVRWERGIGADRLGDIDRRIARGEQGTTAFLVSDEAWRRIIAIWENA